ncbi:MAG: carboxylating nicotinate-nucleotide diphosphorylase [Candidatus Omnitrophica bacterium]|nr:carboxylating nicotinate-nucleotide diphosphorylase [Candidatus Omnitrophota bacterium]
MIHLSIIKTALREDIGKEDITTNFLIDPKSKGKAVIIVREEGITAGLEIAKEVFKNLNSRLEFKALKKEGEAFRENEIVAEVRGFLKPILVAERVALNFLGRLSGIATLTNKFVKEVEDFRVKIMDTRKTTPNLRELEKYAVQMGGGFNHRFSLDEMILIKDNHIQAASCKLQAASKKKENTGLKGMIQKARKKAKEGMKIEVEVSNLEEFKQALEGKPDIIMLDNMDIEKIKKAVGIRNKAVENSSLPFDLTPELEVSGGVNLENIKAIAQTGVERISVGAITHAANWIDFSLKVTLDN